MTLIVLAIKVAGTDLVYETELTVVPPIGAQVKILPPAANYPVTHTVEYQLVDPFADKVVLTLENPTEPRTWLLSGATKAEAETFRDKLIGYGWKNE